MPLVATPENPIPPGAIVEQLRAVDGVKLRSARWTPSRPVRGTVAILGGRAEFIEKYFETIQQLLDRGFAVAALDWRGQGGSARQLRNARKGHVDDFSLFERDLIAFITEVLGPSCPQPWFGLGHSMGAAILLMIAHSGRCPFDRLVLTSPMIQIASMKRPRLLRGLAEVLDALGLGGAFAPGGRSTPLALAPFEGNPLTSDPVRYARMQSPLNADDSIGLGWPTVGWLHAAFRLMRQFEDPDFPRAITTPALVIAAGADRVTDTRACERFSERLRAGRLIVVDGAAHEILIERDIFRDRFWAAFDAFIPGIEGEKAAAKS
jgi:lysophospholipase